MPKFKRKYTLVVIVCVIVLSIIILPLIFQRVIRNALTEAFNKRNINYDLQIESLEPFLFSGSVKLNNVVLKSVNPGDQRFSLQKFTAQSISLDGISLTGLLFHNRISMRSIQINSPDVLLNAIKKKEKKTAGNDIKNLNGIFVGSIKIIDPHLSYYTSGSDSLPLFETKKGYISIEGFTMDAHINDQMFTAKQVVTSLNDLKYVLKDSMYTLSIPHVLFSVNDSIIIIDSLSLQPNFGRKEFSIRAGEQTDVMTALIPRLTCRGFLIRNLVESNELKGDSVLITGTRVSAFRDKNFMRKEKKTFTVQQLLKKINIDVDIRYAHLQNSEVVYEELKENEPKAGKIIFKITNSEVTGLNNRNTENTLTIKSTSKMGAHGSMTSEFNFPFDADSNAFFCKGLMKNFDLKEVNEMTTYNAGFMVTSGEIESMKFNFKATEVQSTGFMDLRYHDLKIFLAGNKASDSSKTKIKVISFLVNKIAIRENVPSSTNKRTTTTFTYKRNPGRFIFNYTWKTLLTGLKQIIPRI